MHYKHLLGYFILLSVTFSSCYSSNFYWQDCGPYNRKLVFNHFNFNPKPIHLRNGKSFFIETDVDVLEDLGPETFVTVRITKYHSVYSTKKIILLKQHSLCDWFMDMNFGWFFRDFFGKGDQYMDCNIKSEVYRFEKDRIFDINDVPLNELLVELIGEANYIVEIIFSNGQDISQEFGCLRLRSLVSLLP